MKDLFDSQFYKDIQAGAPLADRMRPESFDDFFGQDKLVGKKSALRKAIEQDELPSIIFWGPPGSGKTTLARIIANLTKSRFVKFSAVTLGVKEFREIVKNALERRKFQGQRTILFIDEIHRWNKSQQDTLLPYVEKGVVTLIGATTENPSFEIISPLLSRSRVFVLEQLTEDALLKILEKALTNKERGLGKLNIKVDNDTLKYLAKISNGDARIVLNTLEFAVKTVSRQKDGQIILDKKIISQALQKSHYLYDKAGEQHYNIVSALHKSIRGGDADAALYWLARMLEAGEDPLYVARRLVRMAVEDIGLAEPRALEQATAAYQAVHFLGMPEGDLALAQCAVYLAHAPKSIEVYQAYGQAKADVKNTLDEPVPLHLRNAPTKLMKELGYGRNYKYSPQYSWQEEQEYFPEKLKGRRYLSKNKK